MEIKDVILGFLDWKPMTGYELKKLFADLDFLPWSGNNNQIYKGLLELEKEQLVRKTIIPQENLPAQKRYSITAAGKKQLQCAVAQPPDAESLKWRHGFLQQLAWSECLTTEEIRQLVGQFQKQNENELVKTQDAIRNVPATVRRSPREAFIWGMVFRNRVMHLQSELNWLNLLLGGLTELNRKLDSL